MSEHGGERKPKARASDRIRSTLGLRALEALARYADHGLVAPGDASFSRVVQRAGDRAWEDETCRRSS